MLLEWEEILDAVRVLYQERMSGSSTRGPSVNMKEQRVAGFQTALDGLYNVVESTSQTGFDSFFATLPLGEGGRNAAYWVHPDNIVELQVLLLQHCRSYGVRRQSTPVTPRNTLSRQNSLTGSSLSRRDSSSVCDQDTGLLIIDDQEKFVRQQSSTTLEARENTVGVRLQNATVAARWTQDDEATIITQPSVGASEMKNTVIRRKHLAAAINPASPVPASKAAFSEDGAKEIEELRSWCASNPEYQPLATITTNRQRFHDIATDSSGFLLATLDKNISMKQSSLIELVSIDSILKSNEPAAFPYAVLRVRQEGSHASNLIRVLDNSHLLERVRGFSLEYHAVWHCCQPANIVPPFWIPLLQKDIRKVPKSVGWGKRDNSIGSQATTPNMSASNTSESGHGDTTAVEESANNGRVSIVDELQEPPLSSFKKKRSHSYAQTLPKQQYWNEYDNPSDDDDGAYVLFVDPNAESGFSQAWRKVQGIFKPAVHVDEQSLLRNEDSTSSSDEEAHAPAKRHSYGTIQQLDGASAEAQANSVARRTFWPPALTVTCLGASMAIMVVGYLLALTGRKKQYQEVDAGIIFAVISSLLFAVSGVASMFGPGTSTFWPARLIALAILAIDAIASGALLAWILA